MKMIFSVLIGLIPMKETIFGRILCGSPKDDYIIVDDVVDNLEWKSIKEDKKNIKTDYENLIKDMNVSLSEYIDGKKKS